MRKALGLALLALVLAGAASAAPRPTLLLASSRPVVVQGTGFRAHERIRVVASSAGEIWRRTVVATRKGSFSAVIGDMPLGRCGLGVRAMGSRGSIATLKRPPLPACMP